jgi:hypothetical protein
VGLGNPCIPRDKELFVLATKVSIRNGKKTLFWEAPWLDGRKPKDIPHPLILEGSQRRICSVSKALEENFWVKKINTHHGLSLENIMQFSSLGEILQPVQMDPNFPDSISSNVTNTRRYSSKSAYNMQLLGHPKSYTPSFVWRPWVPPNAKSSWLIIQDRVWMADI